MWRFTIEQANRMRCLLTSYRGALYTTVADPTNGLPTADFTFSTSELTASFVDASTDDDGVIAARAWTFGDGGTANTASPSRTYATAGTYDVTLTVTDDLGASDSVTKPVTVVAATVFEDSFESGGTGVWDVGSP